MGTASFAKPDGSDCYPSWAQIARRSFMSDRTARRCARWYQDEGRLHIGYKKSPLGTNIYQFILPPENIEAADQDAKVSTSDLDIETHRPGQQATRPGQQDANLDTHGCPPKFIGSSIRRSERERTGHSHSPTENAGHNRASCPQNGRISREFFAWLADKHRGAVCSRKDKEQIEEILDREGCALAEAQTAASGVLEPLDPWNLRNAGGFLIASFCGHLDAHRKQVAEHALLEKQMADMDAARKAQVEKEQEERIAKEQAEEKEAEDFYKTLEQL